jgi:hypothetical protein
MGVISAPLAEEHPKSRRHTEAWAQESQSSPVPVFDWKIAMGRPAAVRLTAA